MTFSGGPVATAVFNLATTGSRSGTTITAADSGTLACDGAQFDASTLSLGSVYETYYADVAMSDGRVSIASNEAAWIGTPPAVSYSSTSPTGAMMSGTRTTVGNISTYDLSLTFSNFNDSVNPGYTITSGSIHWQATVDVTITLSASSSGNLFLSGGPASSESWNVGYISTDGVTGTFTCNGLMYDARILYFI